MKNQYTVAILLSCFLMSCAKRTVTYVDMKPIKCYYSSIRLKNSNVSETFYTTIKSKGDEFVKIGAIYDKTTNKKIKRTQEPFAIVLNDEVYINMFYSESYRNQGTYIIFDEVGKICALYIDKRDDNQINKGGNSYQLGLGGLLERGINKMGRHWVDKDGKKHKVLTVNTGMPDVGYNANSKLLSKRNFNKQLKTDYSKEEIEGFKFEDVVRIIKEVNSKE